MAQTRATARPLDLDAGVSRRKRFWRSLVSVVVRKKLGALGACGLLFIAFMAVAAPLIAPYDPLAAHYDVKFQKPSVAFPLGTDEFGRDVLSRVIYGARVSLGVGVSAMVLGQLAGAMLGIIAGFSGGKTDRAILPVMDALMSFPTLVLAVLIVAVLGQNVASVIGAIALVQVPRAARVARSASISIAVTQYVEAARAVGAGRLRLLLWHVVPNALAPLIVIATSELGAIILIEASLGFLGLGVPPPMPSWGHMIAGVGRQYVEIAPWLAVFPGLAITITVFCINFAGDALRDVIDPRLRTL